MASRIERYYKNELYYVFDENTSYNQNEVVSKLDNLHFLNDTDLNIQWKILNLLDEILKKKQLLNIDSL